MRGSRTSGDVRLSHVAQVKTVSFQGFSLIVGDEDVVPLTEKRKPRCPQGGKSSPERR